MERDFCFGIERNFCMMWLFWKTIEFLTNIGPVHEYVVVVWNIVIYIGRRVYIYRIDPVSRHGILNSNPRCCECFKSVKSTKFNYNWCINITVHDLYNCFISTPIWYWKITYQYHINSNRDVGTLVKTCAQNCTHPPTSGSRVWLVRWRATFICKNFLHLVSDSIIFEECSSTLVGVDEVDIVYFV